MPNYGVAQAGGPPAALGQGFFGAQLAVIQPGDLYFLWNAEAPVAPQASVAVAMGYAPGGSGAVPVVSFQIIFSAAPTDSLVIQGSNLDVEADYQTLYTSTNKQFDAYSDTGNFLFYRAKAVTWTGGGTVTVLVKR